LVVAGLQLSNLPTGVVASTIAVVGFGIAMIGVAIVLFSATAVLSGGYTTLGQLTDLRNEAFIREELKNKKWSLRIGIWKRRGSADVPPRSVRTALLRAAAPIVLPIMRLARRLTVADIKAEGVAVREMLTYLNRDTIFFSDGLARSVPQLYGLLEEADVDILKLRGLEPAAAPLVRKAPSKSVPAKQAGNEPDIANGRENTDALPEAEWRRARLETAAGQMIAFANQKVMEHRFAKLKAGVRVGGAAVIAGVALFALAPKLAAQKPISIDQPTRVSIHILRPGTFGPSCKKGTTTTGIAIGGTWSKPIVVTESRSGCESRNLTLMPDVGIVTPLGPLPSAPGPSPSPT
jgi:hypothetical protein